MTDETVTTEATPKPAPVRARSTLKEYVVADGCRVWDEYGPVGAGGTIKLTLKQATKLGRRVKAK